MNVTMKDKATIEQLLPKQGFIKYPDNSYRDRNGFCVFHPGMLKLCGTTLNVEKFVNIPFFKYITSESLPDGTVQAWLINEEWIKIGDEIK